MHVPTRVTTSWALAVLFAAATGGGEAWHFIPGNGHLIELPGGYLRVGIALPPLAPGAPAGGPALESGQSESLPCENEGDCAICGLSGQTFSQPAMVAFAAATPFVQDVPPAASCASCESPVLSYRARAPPC